MSKRLFDVIVSVLGVLALLPAFILISIAIKLETRGPVIFRQERVGLNGKLFRIHKFRTMFHNAERGGRQITVAEDQRVTRVGAFLRNYKLDELAQLFDVVLGDMSLVGPRPEVPKYIALYPEAVRETVLSVRPGITDWAAIRFRDEGDILARATDAEKAYVEEVLPVKQQYYLDYVKNRSFVGDIVIIMATLYAVVAK